MIAPAYRGRALVDRTAGFRQINAMPGRGIAFQRWDALTRIEIARDIFPVEILQHIARLGRSEEHTSELQSLMRTTYAVFCMTNKRQPNSYDKKPQLESLMRNSNIPCYSNNK